MLHFKQDSINKLIAKDLDIDEKTVKIVIDNFYLSIRKYFTTDFKGKIRLAKFLIFTNKKHERTLNE